MKILVLYGTTEGQTRKIARYVADSLQRSGDQVKLLDVTEAPWDLWLGEYDAAILAASVHTGQYQSSIVQFARAHYEKLNQMPSMFISVSLSAADKDLEAQKSIVRCAEDLARVSGWKAEVKHVAGAFRFAEYDFFKRWVMKLVAWEKGAKAGAGNSELELTDWAQLDEIVKTFRQRALSQCVAKR